MRLIRRAIPWSLLYACARGRAGGRLVHWSLTYMWEQLPVARLLEDEHVLAFQ